MNIYEVLKGPCVTEKSEMVRAVEQSLCFRVHPDATKTDVKNAVQKIFSVKVSGVRTANYDGKLRRRGRYAGYKSNWKKAYVKLAEGQKMVEYAQV